MELRPEIDDDICRYKWKIDLLFNINVMHLYSKSNCCEGILICFSSDDSYVYTDSRTSDQELDNDKAISGEQMHCDDDSIHSVDEMLAKRRHQKKMASILF